MRQGLEDGAKRVFRTLCATALAIGLICSPMTAFADGGAGGGGGDGGNSGGPTMQKNYGYWWYDDGTFSPTGEFTPAQGWDDASIASAKARMEAQTGRKLSVGGFESDGKTTHYSRFKMACDSALKSARARAGKPNARIVGLGYAWSPLFNSSNMGFWWTTNHTFQRLLPRIGNGTELPASIGWDDIKSGTNKTWRQYAYDQAAADLTKSNYRIVAVAVAKSEPQGTGIVEVRKSPTDANLVEGNLNYALAGAVYGVYSSADCPESSLVTKITTDDAGRGRVTLPAGRTYWVREISASKGYKVNPEIRQVMVTTGTVSPLDVKEDHKHTRFDMFKVIRGEGHGVELGDVSLAGAEIELKMYRGGTVTGTPTWTWRFVSDADGKFLLDDEHVLEGSDPLPRKADGAISFPLGTYTMQEIKAPDGLLLEGQTNSHDADYKAPVHTFDSARLNGSVNFDIENPQRMYEASIVKLDSELGNIPQGDGELHGARFAMWNASKNPVVWRGKKYAPGDKMSDELIVSWDEHAKRYDVSFDDIPYGSYRIREVEPGISYELNTLEYMLVIR